MSKNHKSLISIIRPLLILLMGAYKTASQSSLFLNQKKIYLTEGDKQFLSFVQNLMYYLSNIKQCVESANNLYNALFY